MCCVNREVLQSRRRFFPAWHSADDAPPAWGDPARVRGRGQTAAAGLGPRAPMARRWFGQTTALAGGDFASCSTRSSWFARRCLKEQAAVVLVAGALAFDVTPTARNGTRGSHRKHTRRRPAAVRATTVWM